MTKTPGQEKLWFLDTLVTIRVGEHDSLDGISVIEHQVPFGSSPPLHVHHNEDEVFHVLSGEARFRLAGQDVRAAAGDTLVAPKGVPHTFLVTSPDGARWLTVTRNGDFERMVRATARPAEADALPPCVPPTPEQVAALEAACNANGIALVGPPLAA
jgi:mannose-6-phosphate isomerase-like protein (cupin superfamily)